MPSATMTQPRNYDLELFCSRGSGVYWWTAWGLFCDAIAEREICTSPRRLARWDATLAGMWGATFNVDDPHYIGARGADQVGPLLWTTVGRLCKYGHPMPENVTPEILKEAVYVERRKEWREGYAQILGIDSMHVTVDDLTKGL